MLDLAPEFNAYLDKEITLIAELKMYESPISGEITYYELMDLADEEDTVISELIELGKKHGYTIETATPGYALFNNNTGTRLVVNVETADENHSIDPQKLNQQYTVRGKIADISFS